ncbi:uncharacterized protein KY384_007724 [Bacidia gigantensis]|uniref:uncharacterized protein n=1 Tax=Bacidia gigantensis TaxID=2732470 RepID=UPI001D04BA15|nr:uncharacterized protein KY384_007724 [Bacidia gigantensis]KAG8527571.1 hypothetical protein KY384_007724 [Bacidia gigantensis]
MSSEAHDSVGAAAEKTGAININGEESSEPSKSALKKAQKQQKMAEEKAAKAAKLKEAQVKPAAKKSSGKEIEGAELKAINIKKEADFAGWYAQVLTKGGFISYTDISGCYVYRPASYVIWEQITAWFDKRIKSIGVKNCYFPMFATKEQLEIEKDHVEGFAAEVAWVTKYGNSQLEKEIAIRPTSETVMYGHYANWIRSHRDLPLRLNQWNSVVRWEFKHPQPFLRTREFLWQEGHTAHLTKQGSEEEVLQILEWYAGVYEELLAVPVIRGRKTDKEKFAGGDYTTTVEGYIPETGRGIQGGTSHCLGQNFSKMFNIVVEDPANKEGAKLHVWQNSWGLSTRTIGVMVMIHSDNRGLVLPPRVAETQVVIVPVGITAKTSEDQKTALHKEVDALEAILKAVDLRVISDKSEGYSPGWKFNEWEQKGVPLRLEFGPGESKGHYVTTSRRDIPGKEGKGQIAITELGAEVPKLLSTIQSDLYDRADQTYKQHTKQITAWDEFVPSLNAKNVNLIPHCLTEKCEDKVKELSAKRDTDDNVPQDEKAPSMGAKSLCIPFKQPSGGLREGTQCLNPECDNKAVKWCLFGRSY